VQSSAVLRTLQDRALIDAVGRAEGLGRPLLYGTTKKFLEHFVTRLRQRDPPDWCLVATSCVEAGVDFSFRSGFRERFSASSTIQTGGRINRNSEYDSSGGGIVYD